MWPDTNAIAKAGLLAARLGPASCPTTRCPTPRRSSSSSARAIRRASRTGPTSSSPASRSSRPNPKTSGNGKLSLPGRVGLRHAARRLGSRRPRVREEALRAGSRPRPRRARRDHDLRAEEDRRRAPRVGERGAPRGRGSRRCGRDRLSADQLLRRAARRGRRRKNAERKGTREAAQAYLEFLYTPEGQEIIAKNFYRPTNPDGAREAPRARSRTSSSSRSTRSPRTGTTPTPSTSATAGSSTASTSPRSSRPESRGDPPP